MKKQPVKKDKEHEKHEKQEMPCKAKMPMKKKK